MNKNRHNVYLCIGIHPIKTKKIPPNSIVQRHSCSVFGKLFRKSYELVNSHFSDIALFWFVLFYPINSLSVLLSDVISCLFAPIKPLSRKRRESTWRSGYPLSLDPLHACWPRRQCSGPAAVPIIISHHLTLIFSWLPLFSLILRAFLIDETKLFPYSV